MNPERSPCIDPAIDPLLTELRGNVDLVHTGPAHPLAPRLQDFVAAVFRRAHSAEVSTFHPQLIGLTTDAGLRAVLGYRCGGDSRLFSEQYLDLPAEQAIARVLAEPVERGQLVEVGNFALADPGHARWVIAAMTAFLVGAGYRWVLFTATRPLFNAFRRLGLKPQQLACADPERLAGGGDWGRYYECQPMVYAGDVLAGWSKLRSCGGAQGAQMQALLLRARALGELHAAGTHDDAPLALQA